ncbi:unnamed protein product, partial [Musa hybrid cultivar]
MFPMVTRFMNHGQQIIRATRYIGQSFIITLSHINHLPITIQYAYEKSITSERFGGRIHFEFDKYIACEVCVRVCLIDLSIVDWRLERDVKKKQLLNYSIDFGVCIFCDNLLSIVQQT